MSRIRQDTQSNPEGGNMRALILLSVLIAVMARFVHPVPASVTSYFLEHQLGEYRCRITGTPKGGAIQTQFCYLNRLKYEKRRNLSGSEAASLASNLTAVDQFAEFHHPKNNFGSLQLTVTYSDGRSISVVTAIPSTRGSSVADFVESSPLSTEYNRWHERTYGCHF